MRLLKYFKLRKLKKQLSYANAMIRKYVGKNDYQYMKYIKIRDEIKIKIEEISK